MHITTSQSVSQFRRGPHALTYTNVDRNPHQETGRRALRSAPLRTPPVSVQQFMITRHDTSCLLDLSTWQDVETSQT